MIKFLQNIFKRKTHQYFDSNINKAEKTTEEPISEPCELKWVNKDEEEQTVDCEVSIGGKYSHTVKVGYFTQKQIDLIEKAKKELGYV